MASKLKLSCDNLTFRPAELKDRLELFDELSENIYNGHDYLPLFFERWLHDTRHYMICATSEGANDSSTILALDTIGLFDDGTTVLFQALRVHPAARGKRVASRLSAYLATYVKERFPTVKRLRAVIQHHNMGSIRLHAKQGYTQLHCEAFGMAAIDAKARAVFHAGGAYRPSRQFVGKRMNMVSKEVFWQHLSSLSPDDKDRLLPSNLILSDWMPYEVSESNLHVMEQEEGMAFWVVLDTTKATLPMVGFVVSQRSQRCSGTHLFNCIRCHGNAKLAQWMTSIVCYYLHHGCSHLCLSYDQQLRDAMYKDTTIESAQQPEPDFGPVPWLVSLQDQLPYLDFAADYVGGSQTVYELVL
eukprot:m.22644 g.22644  ORF g.22644 m.22644 type:complete len:358 (-) comp11276_c0_seq1:170-1243(-)